MTPDELKNTYPINTFGGQTRIELEKAIDAAYQAGLTRAGEIARKFDDGEYHNSIPCSELIAAAIEREKEGQNAN